MILSTLFSSVEHSWNNASYLSHESLSVHLPFLFYFYPTSIC
jgi:hypothetical protein